MKRPEPAIPWHFLVSVIAFVISVMQVSIVQALSKNPSQVSRAISKLLEVGLIGRDRDGRLVAK